MNAVDRLDSINSEIKILREQKSQLNKRKPKHKKELKRIRRRMFDMAMVRNKLPLDLKWNAEELKRREEEEKKNK